MRKRIVSIVLALCMVLALMPQMAFAEGAGNPYTLKEGTNGAADNEGPGSLLDGNTSTKWCVTGFESAYIIFSTDSPVNVSGYSITTGGDNSTCTDRNPKNWTLYGCNDYMKTGTEPGTGTWTAIHSVTNDTILQDMDKTTYSYVFEQTQAAYQYYKLEITETKGADVMQMGEFELISCAHTWNTSTTEPSCTTAGYTTKNCSTCTGVMICDYKEPLGHEFSVEDNKCIYCSYTYEELLQSGYLDENGELCPPNNSAVPVTDSPTTWSSTGENPGWYVAEGSVTIDSRVTVSGNVHLILMNGCDLTINGGIKVEGSENSLTIYAQSVPVMNADGTVDETKNKAGKLTSISNNNAGIGGSTGGNGGNITINGGIVTATSEYGAGIGGGASGQQGGSGGNITINGGVVTAITESDSAGFSNHSAGIGGGETGMGSGGSGGKITINGGIVTATANGNGAGIGGGGGQSGGGGGIITITGGIVTATTISRGAGIGGGGASSGTKHDNGGSGGKITITGGTVTATITEGAGIGSGKNSSGTAGGSGTFSTAKDGIAGNAVIFAKSISDQSGKENESWRGVIFEGDSEGKIYGSTAVSPVTPNNDFTIPAGKTLKIENNQALAVGQGVELTKNGTITNNGKIFVDGKLTGEETDNLYYPLTLVGATATENTSAYNNNTYGKAGSEITLTPAAPEGYEFTRWDAPIGTVAIGEGIKITMPSEAIAVTARFSTITYNITYDLKGGTAANPASYTIESNAIKLNNPTKENYTFTGWSGTDLTGADNMTVTIPTGSTDHRTYTAHWKPDTYTVNLNTNGGTINSGNVTGYTYGQGATLPTDVTKAGYIFKGWYENENFAGDPIAEISATDTGVKKFYAKWAANSYYPISQKPTIQAGEGVKVTLSADGKTATITVDDGYEIADVMLNGVSLGKVTEVKNLKTGDKLVVTVEKKEAEPTKEEILVALADQQLTARSKLVTMKSGKKAIKIAWYNENGEMMDFDGVEIYRSTKRNSGYGKKPIFTTEKSAYYNTAIQEGTKYYYKVRGFVIIDGQKHYTDYSRKAIRTVE